MLRCKSCDAPVALGIGDIATCAHCGAGTPIPEAHRALREADAREAAHRAAADELARKIGTQPALPLRIAAATWNLLFFIFIGLPFVLVVGGALGHGVFMRYRASLPAFSDPEAAAVAFGYAGAVVLVGAWIVVAAYGSRRAIRLRELQAGLAAQEPERAGGARRCRVCAAPLEVPAGALAVACLYCRADNLVAIPPSWIVKAKARSTQLAAAIGDATREYFAELARLRRRVIVQSLVLLVIGGGLVGLFIAVAISGDPPPPRHDDFDWKTAIAFPQLRRDRRQLDGVSGDAPPTVFRRDCAADGSGQTLRFGRGDCTKDGCVVHFYVPLRHDHEITLRGVDLPWKTLAAFYERDGTRPFHQAHWGKRVDKPAWIGGDREATFRAPHDGWFMLWIAALEGGAELTPYRLCVRLAGN